MPFLVNVGDSFAPRFETRTLPAISLDGLFGTSHERVARGVLEKFGAVDIDLCDDLEADGDELPDYVVAPNETDTNTVCTFIHDIQSALKKRDIHVAFDSGFPFQVFDTKANWYADISGANEEPADITPGPPSAPVVGNPISNQRWQAVARPII